MKYLMRNVRIFKGTNSRGDYHWMYVELFNDEDVAANPTRAPHKPILVPAVVEAFLACTNALTENPQGWIDVDMSKVPDEGLTKHHLNNVNPEVVALDGFYQPVYSRDFTDNNGVMRIKGSVRIGASGSPVPPVNALKVYVQYYEAETFENGQKVKRWIPVETKEELAQITLERSYRKIQPAIGDAGSAGAPETAPEEGEETAEQKKARLQAELAALNG